MTYFMRINIKCVFCQNSFDFTVTPEDGAKKVICPKCERDHGTVEMEIDLNEMIMTEWSPDPMPAPTIKFRSSNPSNPVATVDIETLGNMTSQSNSSD